MNAIIATGLSGIEIQCSPDDLMILDPPAGETCDRFLSGLSQYSIENPGATSDCRVCPFTTADELLNQFDISFSDRWWEFGVTMAYNLINVGLTLLLYWLARVPKSAKKEEPQREMQTKNTKGRNGHQKKDSGHSLRSLTRPTSDENK
jgi:ABC-type multidrug transport system permease subunit